MKPIKINLPSILFSLATLIILSYIVIDIFITKPEFKQRVDNVAYSFDSLTVFLTAKLPEIDSALYIHTQQIADQNEQLLQLNKLTEILKEE